MNPLRRTIARAIARVALEGAERGEKSVAHVAPIGRGRSKSVYADPHDAAHVVVHMQRDAVTESFLDFARDAHARDLAFARHLPDPGPIERRADGALQFRTARLEPNTTRARVGRENGNFFLTGLAEDDPQRASILEAMDALDRHLKKKAHAHRYFFDLNPQNFMRRADGSLVINDPVEIAKSIALVGAGAGAAAGAGAQRLGNAAPISAMRRRRENGA